MAKRPTKEQFAELRRELQRRCRHIDDERELPRELWLSVLSARFGVSTAKLQAIIREIRGYPR